MNPEKTANSYDLTLILPPLWDVTRPWTATACLAEYMKSLGYRVQFLDYNIRLFQRFRGAGCGALWDTGHLTAWTTGQFNFLVHMLDLDEIGGSVIGISTGCTNLPFCIELARVLRRKFPRRKILFGGHEVFLPEEVARVPVECADAICKGEGEYTLRDVMQSGFRDLEQIPGLYLPTEQGWRLTGERDLIRDLDSLPFLTFDECEVGLYTRRFLPLVGSRGCINRCNYCYDRYMMRACYRTRSAKHQLDELEYLNKRYDVEHFPYNDSLLNGDVRIMAERAEGILKRGLTLEYGGNLMVRDNMDEALFATLRKSGFTVGLIGVESGSASVLKAMRKRHTPDSAAAFVKRCHDAGIRTELNFIVGFPGETEAHFQETLDWVRQNERYIDVIISVTTCNLFPSELWEQREVLGLVTYPDNTRTSWHTRDRSNTYEIRLERFSRMMNLAAELGKISAITMTDTAGAADDFPTLTEKLVLEYIRHWRETPGIDGNRRREVLDAVKDWTRIIRNRKIARTLDKIGLFEPARSVYRKVTGRK